MSKTEDCSLSALTKRYLLQISLTKQTQLLGMYLEVRRY